MKENLIQDLDEALERMNEDVLSKLDMSDDTPVTRKELREYMLVIQFCQLAIRDAIELYHKKNTEE